MALTLKNKLSALGLLVLVVFLMSTMNYVGYCIPEGRILSDDEKIRLAIEHWLKTYPPDLTIVAATTAPGWSYISRPNDLIYYKDVDEFFAINADCCKFVEYFDAEWGPPGSMERLTGTVSGRLQIAYQLRYIEDAVGKAISAQDPISVSNCGVPTRGVSWQSPFQQFIGFNPSDLLN